MTKQIIILTYISILLFTGCKSPEFTSALMYVNENNLEKAEEFSPFLNSIIFLEFILGILIKKKKIVF